MSASWATADALCADPVRAEPDWLAQNEEVISLGIAWLEQRLAGEDGNAQRAAWEGARAAMVDAGRPAAIDRLGAAFALSPFEEDVLMLALAPAIDGGFGARGGAADGQAYARPPSPHLLARLLTGDERLPTHGLRSLSTLGMLRRFALIDLDERSDVAAHAAITLPERVRHLLCGIDAPDVAIEALTRPLPTVPLHDRLEALATRIACSAEAPLRLQIIGPPRSGRRCLASAIAARLGLACRRLLVLPSGPAETAALMRECVLDGAALLVDEDGDEGLGKAALTLGQALPTPLFVVARQPVEGLEALLMVRTPAVQPDERMTLWLRSGAALAETVLAGMAEHFALGPSEIHTIARAGGTGFDAAWSACREFGARELEALSTHIAPERGFDEMVLDAAVLADLQGLVAQVARRGEVHRDWGYRRILGRATGISALFAGPSGVGKTMAAEAIAKALALDLYVVDLARVTSKYIGETEKNLRRIFDAAEAGGCVLFFDEADALFGKRSEVKDSHDRYANAEISYLLQRMESFGGLSILATNLKSHLDAAFLRRIRILVDFPVPDVAVRKMLWRRALPPTAPQHGIDWEALARHELTGGNITTVAANAAFRASAQGESIGMAIVMAAMAAEFRKLGRDPSTLGIAP